MQNVLIFQIYTSVCTGELYFQRLGIPDLTLNLKINVVETQISVKLPFREL